MASCWDPRPGAVDRDPVWSGSDPQDPGQGWAQSGLTVPLPESAQEFLKTCILSHFLKHNPDASGNYAKS